jgi:magnesium transporter
MLNIYKSTENEIVDLDKIEKGAWVNLVNPTDEEILTVSNSLKIPLEHLKAALDEEERARIEVDKDCTIVLIDIPVENEDTCKKGMYYTIPLGVIINNENIVTVSLRENSVIARFLEKKVKYFHTSKKTRFLLQILYRNSREYLQYL